MKNPWEEISLDDYENHMSLDSVRQLQTLNALMKEQFEARSGFVGAILECFEHWERLRLMGEKTLPFGK